MAFFNTCEYCNAALDPGEKCDCRKARAERKEQDKATKRIRKVQRIKDLLPINTSA